MVVVEPPALTPDSRTLALRDLRAAITAVRDHVDPGSVAALDALAALVVGLDTPLTPGPVANASEGLQRLLALAGPDTAPMLLRQLVQDFTQCRDDLAQAVAAPDWQAGRNGSHVLMSLAGSVGAVALQALAEAFNQAAHRQDAREAANLLPPIQAGISALIRLIEAMPPGAASPPEAGQ